MLKFSLLGSSPAVLSPRLGSLTLAGRKPISTPHYIPLTSRGAVPHLAHDVMRDNTSLGSLYIEKRQQFQKSKLPIPLYAVPTAPPESALRKFICLPDDLLLILGARREPPIACPASNTDSSIAISTSLGFTQLEATDYVGAIQRVSPDIVVGLADLVIGQPPGVKRQVKMVDRTHAFTTHATDNLYGPELSEHSRSTAAYFAPVLPLENTQQQLYLEDLETDMRPFVSGLALYEPASLSVVPETLGDLPRLLFSQPDTPHDLLREIELGADLLTIPFLNTASDAGMSFNFVFPAPASLPSDTNQTTEPLPLADNLWSPTNATDTNPLLPSCPCYTCQHHHRAYIHHLLSAKEMLAWTLLQIHNHATMDSFFASIRASIGQGTFESDVATFQRVYASEFPEITGEGPRLRGYKLPSAAAAQPRKYPPAYGRLDDLVKRDKLLAEAQSDCVTPDTGAEGLEEHGFAKKI
ncbi:hypothetical protein BDV06DRAFT_211488 [Aspergillus oleicola]